MAAARDRLTDLPDVIDLVRKAINDDPPATAKNGGVIRPGYSKELDEMTGILHSGKNWIVELQQQEREKTGIKSLKIGYNRVFGYYIDVSRTNTSLVPARYERRQTTATGERYTIPELREKEALITNADERVLALERTLYTRLIDEIRIKTPRSSGFHPRSPLSMSPPRLPKPHRRTIMSGRSWMMAMPLYAVTYGTRSSSEVLPAGLCQTMWTSRGQKPRL